jgi:major vault protein
MVEKINQREQRQTTMPQAPMERAFKPRNKSEVVKYKIHHNGAIQIYDYKEKKARVVFGPDLVMLGPDEQFTLIRYV